MTPDASFGPFFFPGCYTRCGGFTVVWALVTARGGRGVLGKKIVVCNKNMLVSLHNNNKKTKKKREEIYLGRETQLRLESRLLLKWWWSRLGTWWWWWWWFC